MAQIIIDKKQKKIIKEEPSTNEDVTNYVIDNKIPAIHKGNLIIVDDKDISKEKLKKDLKLTEEN